MYLRIKDGKQVNAAKFPGYSTPALRSVLKKLKATNIVKTDDRLNFKVGRYKYQMRKDWWVVHEPRSRSAAPELHTNVAFNLFYEPIPDPQNLSGLIKLPEKLTWSESMKMAKEIRKVLS